MDYNAYALYKPIYMPSSPIKPSHDLLFFLERKTKLWLNSYTYLSIIRLKKIPIPIMHNCGSHRHVMGRKKYRIPLWDPLHFPSIIIFLPAKIDRSCNNMDHQLFCPVVPKFQPLYIIAYWNNRIESVKRLGSDILTGAAVLGLEPNHACHSSNWTILGAIKQTC